MIVDHSGLHGDRRPAAAGFGMSRDAAWCRRSAGEHGHRLAGARRAASWPRSSRTVWCVTPRIGACGSSRSSFPEAIDLIAGALRAGHAFTTASSMVADEVPDPVGAEFRLLLRPAELRHAAARRAEAVRAARAAPRRPLLRHGRADATRSRRQPVGGARQPGVASFASASRSSARSASSARTAG